MNTEDFEKQLERQSLRQIPVEWRGHILSAARQASKALHAKSSARATCRIALSTLSHQLSTLLWPCPQAWAGLAAVWVAVLVFSFATRDESRLTAGLTRAPSAQVLTALTEQKRFLAELLGPPEAPVAERPKMVAPRPHSERRSNLSNV
jgi:hypothetical protein